MNALNYVRDGYKGRTKGQEDPERRSASKYFKVAQTHGGEGRGETRRNLIRAEVDEVRERGNCMKR